MDLILDSLSQFWLNFRLGQLPALGGWNYLLLMVVVVIQGPFATMLGGAAAAAGLLNPLGVLAACVAGNLGADVIWYTLGRLSKLGQTGRWSRRSQTLVRVLREGMHDHALGNRGVTGTDQRLRPLHLDDADSTDPRWGQVRTLTQGRDLDALLLGSLEDGQAVGDG